MGTKIFPRIMLFLIALLYVCSSPLANSVCEFTFNDCPLSYNGDTIVVPENVVAMSSSIKACSTTINSISGSSLPPSIMFVIDHSGSMTGSDGKGGNDEMGSRFTVTRAIIDTLYKRQPNAEVGVTVFREHLFFDKTTGQDFTTYFKTLPVTYDKEPGQAYLQMLTLNRMYGSKKGIDIIKDVLATDTVKQNSVTYTDLIYKPSFTNTTYTNINVGFIAAKDAMKSAVNPPERQFVIFFSDGEPNGSSQAGLPINDFTSGNGMPTTFTVYFTSGKNAPPSIQTMTNNIKTNNYSTSNPKSNLWAIQTNYDALLNLLMSNVINNLLIAGNPSTMTINGIQSSSSTDSSFVFTNKFPLNAGTTSFNSVIRYSFTNPVDKTTRDTTVTLNFVVRRSNKTLNASIKTNCWEQPVINFYYNNVLITEATEDMKQIKVQVNPNNESVTSVSVDLKSSLETMPVNLSRDGDNWATTFTQETKTSAINDNILQHISGDSIIAVYRNPLLPLDTVRVVLPIRARPNGVPVTAVLRDTSGDGHIDRIDLSWTLDTVSLITVLPAISSLLTNATITALDGSIVTLNANALIKKGDRALSVTINENKETTLETGWTNATVILSTITMTKQGNSFFIEKITDGSGPVIDRAIYYPGTSTGTQSRDTLKITLSEPVKCNSLSSGSPAEAFNYLKNGTLAPELLSGATFLTNCNGGYVTEIKLVLKPGVVITPGKDSLSLIGNNHLIVDQYGNYPSLNNRRVPIEWGVQNEIQIAVSKDPIDQKTVQLYANSTKGNDRGILVGISSLKPLLETTDKTFGTATIYDALGNIMISSIPVIESVLNNNYGVFWDERNSKGRTVSSGVYLMLIKFTSDDKNWTQKVKIAVKAKRNDL